MGRESTITFEQVASMADAMVAEGLKPASRSLRERLGNTGSMGTINKLLGRWKSGQERQASATLALPPALQRVLLEFVGNELAGARAALESELADQQQEASDLATENERQVVENESQSEEIELLRAEVSAHKGRAGQLESDLVVARDEAARERSGAELARTELAKALLRLESLPRLEADLVAVRGTLEAERLARVTAEQQAAVLAAKIEASDRRATEAEARTTKNEARADAMSGDLIRLNAVVQAGQARQAGLASELDDAKKAAALAHAAAKKSGEEAAELRGQQAAKKEKEVVVAKKD